MFKLHIYSKRTLNSIPPFAGPARRAERRYKAVDPDNRVVARTLEAEWEARLRERQEITHEYEAAKRQQCVQLSEQNRARIRDLARDLPYAPGGLEGGTESGVSISGIVRHRPA